MRHYATLFDKSYAPKGLCLYESLKRHSTEDFTLHVLALDSETAWLLAELALPHVEILPLASHAKAMNLEHIEGSRTWQEVCWTAASQLMEYLLPWLCPLPWEGEVTYLDSDVYFFADPKAIFDELGERSIGITPHRLIPSKKHLEGNGLFNVGVVVARNDEAGKRCIAKWAAQCRFRCSATVGCGDQKYLDEWPLAYGQDVCIFQNIGINAGPWSIGNWTVTEGPKLDGVPLVAYHFHEYQSPSQLTNYDLRYCDISWIYWPYSKAWSLANTAIALAEERIRARRGQMAMQGDWA